MDTKIKISLLSGETLELSISDAKDLFAQLQELFDVSFNVKYTFEPNSPTILHSPKIPQEEVLPPWPYNIDGIKWKCYGQ